VAQAKKQVCLICGKPSPKMICDTCSAKLRGEALDKKKKQEKVKEE
jgi:predicted amidophosphoribosyltransferase